MASLVHTIVMITGGFHLGSDGLSMHGALVFWGACSICAVAFALGCNTFPGWDGQVSWMKMNTG
jgi:hypothetical protein